MTTTTPTISDETRRRSYAAQRELFARMRTVKPTDDPDTLDALSWYAWCLKFGMACCKARTRDSLAVA